MSVLEMGTRVPLLMRVPWIKTAQGKKTMALAELVDLYPTLADLANVPMPTGAAAQYLGGVSLRPILENPENATVKSVALSQMTRCWQNNTHHPKGQKPGDENNSSSVWENMRWV